MHHEHGHASAILAGDKHLLGLKVVGREAAAGDAPEQLGLGLWFSGVDTEDGAGLCERCELRSKKSSNKSEEACWACLGARMPAYVEEELAVLVRAAKTANAADA